MILLFILLIPLYLLVDDISTLSAVTIIIYFIRGVQYYKKNRIISFIDVWNLGFVFIVISEMIQLEDFLFSNGLNEIKFIFITNVLINIGFYVFKRLSNINHTKCLTNNIYLSRKQLLNINFFLLLLSALYFSIKITTAIQSFFSSRAEFLGDSMGSGSLKETLIGSIGVTVPVIAAYLFRYHQNYKYKFLFFFIILLNVAPQVLWGTRFVLLYSIVAPLILLIDLQKINFKKAVLLIASILLLVFISKFILETRKIEITTIQYTQKWTQQIASYGSNEGIVRGTLDINKYTKENGFSYGRESIFPIYFWVPRKWWVNKPTQLSYWLPREYNRNISIAYSGAYGYWGELLIDFGYYSLPLFFFIGILLGLLESKKNHHLYNKSIKVSFYYVILGGAFFSIRSPQTVFPTLVFSYILFFIITKIIFTINKKALN